MANKNRSLRRTSLCVALGACIALMAAPHVAMAASNDGSVAGQAAPGATVTVVSPETGFTRTITADADGDYRFPFLPIGEYQLRSSAGGAPVGVTVRLGTTTTVDLAGTTNLAAVQVVGSTIIPMIDVTSTEVSTVVTRRELERLPVDQTISSVAVLAPGVQKGDASFGGLTFGGSSVAENSVYINGLNVTDFYNRVGYSVAPFAFYQEFQVKTGGYSVEFGRSTGGVINAVTRSGTNEFHFGAELTAEPRDWQAHAHDRYGEDGLRYVTASRDNYSLYKLNVYASGPIIKDNLFFFAMYEARDFESNYTNNAGTNFNNNNSDDGFWGAKLDWQVTDNNLIELMAFSDENAATTSTYEYDYASDEVGNELPGSPIFGESGGINWNATWTSYLTNGLSMKLMYGQTERNNSQYSAADLACSPVAQADVIPGAFPAPPYPLGCGESTRVEERLDERTAIRADFEWQLGDHLLRFGADHEENVSNYNRHYPGPDQTYYTVYYLDEAGAEIPDSGGASLPSGEHAYVRARQYGVNGQFETINSAFYLEDNWQITDKLLLNLGIRQEAFDNKNSDGDSYIKMDDMWAPRFGFSWDMAGDGTMKLYGNLGRYFLPVANVINIKQAGGFLDARTYYVFEGWEEVTRDGTTYVLPILGEQLAFDNSQGDGTVGDLRSEVDADMDPVYQDELILGFQQAFNNTWSWGVQATYRDLHNAIDDMEIDATACGRNGPGWVMANPGELVTFWGDTDCDGENDGYVTIDTSVEGYWTEDDFYQFVQNPDGDPDTDDSYWGYVYSETREGAGQWGWVKPERTYKAIELQLDRAWDGKWGFNASYVWSKLEGNAEGPVNSDTNFADSGRTENFDDPWVNYRGYGPLYNDHRHQLKFRGAYAFTEHWRVGGTLNAQSGGPITGFGVGNPFNWSTYHSYYICVEDCSPEDTYPNAADGDLWNTGERIYEHSGRGDYGRMPWTYNVGVSLSYLTEIGNGDLEVKFAIYNLLNEQEVIDVDQDLQESPSAGLNSTFRRPTTWQSPRFGQLTVSLDF